MIYCRANHHHLENAPGWTQTLQQMMDNLILDCQIADNAAFSQNDITIDAVSMCVFKI